MHKDHCIVVMEREPRLEGLREALGEHADSLVRVSSGQEAILLMQGKNCDFFLVDPAAPGALASVGAARKRFPALPIVWIGPPSGEIFSAGASDCISLGDGALKAKADIYRALHSERHGSELMAQEALLRSSEELERLVLARSAELAKSLDFLDSLIENLPLMVFVKDAKTLRFVRFNKAGENLIGFSRNDMLGRNDYDFFPKEQADFFTGKDRAVLLGKTIVDIPEESIETKYLGTRILHTKKIPVLGPDGNPEYLLGISEDITEAKRAEEQNLRLIEERAARREADRTAANSFFLAEASRNLSSSLDYRVTLKNLADFVVQGFCDWCTITLNEAGELRRVAAAHRDAAKLSLVEELFSYSPSNGPEESLISGVLGSGTPLYLPEVQDSVLRKIARDERHFGILKGLDVRSCLVVPLRAHEQIFGALAFVSSGISYSREDLSTAEELGRRAGMAVENARLYEQAQRAIQLRSEFLSIASHELRTPVTSLKLQVQMARRKIDPVKGTAPSPDRLMEIFDLSERQVNRLAALIDDLLDVSRIDAGRLSYDFERDDLSDIVKEVTLRLGDQLEAAACPLQLELEKGTMVLCDRFRLEQVAVNLVTNALKYGAGKPIRIRVKKQDGRALLEVKDEGIGIDPAHQQRIFDRFERAISHNNISGLGLGLFISKQIVIAHEGEIRVKSRLGTGSEFSVELPLA